MIKLLLVEDDANLCYIIQSGLQDLIGGYEVITASNGKDHATLRDDNTNKLQTLTNTHSPSLLPPKVLTKSSLFKLHAN